MATYPVTGYAAISATKLDSFMFINNFPAAGYVACRGLHNQLSAS